MTKGDKVRVWKPVPGVPLKAVGTVLRTEDEEPYWDDTQGDIYITHVEVDFGEHGVHWVNDYDIAVVGDWRDRLYEREEATREEREEKTRQSVQELLKTLRGMAGDKPSV